MDLQTHPHVLCHFLYPDTSGFLRLSHSAHMNTHTPYFLAWLLYIQKNHIECHFGNKTVLFLSQSVSLLPFMVEASYRIHDQYIFLFFLLETVNLEEFDQKN